MTINSADQVTAVIEKQCQGRTAVLEWFAEHVVTNVDAAKVAAGCCAVVGIFGRSHINALKALHGGEKVTVLAVPDLGAVNDDPIQMRVAQIAAAASNDDMPAAHALIDAASSVDDEGYTIVEVALALVEQAHMASHMVARIPGSHP